MTNTLFLDGKQYHYKDPEHLQQILARDYPNEPLPDWIGRQLAALSKDVKRRGENVPVLSQLTPGISSIE
jgi:hypothetical protein